MAVTARIVPSGDGVGPEFRGVLHNLRADF
jgi:hypothetical protein